MGVSTFVQPDFTSQSATIYKTSIDDGVAVHHQIAGAFAPHERPSPDLRVSLDAANFSDLVTRTTITKVAQITSVLTAPSVNPRKDIVYVDRTTGNVGVIAGAEDASPVDPTIPVDKLPVARINWTTSMTEITNADLDDIRAIGGLGLGSVAFVDFNADGGLTLEDIGAGTSTGPILDLYRNSSTPADDDNIGAVEFTGENGVPEKHIYARIVAKILTVADGSEASRLRFLTEVAGTLSERMKLEAGLQLGSPTDGDKGAGTGNFENGVYVDGVLNGFVLDTEQATTSGTEIDFTSLPAGIKRITIMFEGVSTGGTDNWLIQIGDAGGIEASGYLGTGSGVNAATNYTAGFGIRNATDAGIVHGAVTLTLMNASTNTWVASGVLGKSDGADTFQVAGSKPLTAVLDRIRLTTTGGTDAFDAGALNILYES